MQIRISVNLNFELLNFKFELANLRTFLNFRTSPYLFPRIFSSDALSSQFKRQNPLFECNDLLSNGFAHIMAMRERGNDDALSFFLRDEKGKVHMFEKTKIGSARERSASRPHLLETPAGHEVFVKRRYCFAPARRRPIDQLD